MEFLEADKNKDKAKTLSLLTFKWLRELDLNQRPSGYEEQNALFSILITCNHNLSELIKILCLQIFQPNLSNQMFLYFITTYQNFCNFFVTGCRLKIPPFYNNKPPTRVKFKIILFSRARKTSEQILKIKS